MSFLEKGECGYALPYMGMLMEVAGRLPQYYWGESRPFSQQVEFQSRAAAASGLDIWFSTMTSLGICKNIYRMRYHFVLLGYTTSTYSSVLDQPGF